MPDTLVALWKDRYLDRVDLQALSEREVEQMVDDLLGAPSHALAYKWIYRVSQGNPLFVTEIIADVRRTGRLELRDGRWHLDEGRKPFERLSELLASHIGSVSAEAHAALEMLALGTPMRLSVFEELASADALEELERASLAVVSHDGRGPVRRGRPSALRRSGAREPACVSGPAHPARPRRSARRSRGRHPQERLAVARLMLESGQVDEDRFLEASAIALRLGAPDLAGNLAAAVPPSLRAALCLAQARAGAARFGDVEAVLAPFEDEAAAGEAEVAAAYVETRVRGLLRAGETLERIRPFIARFETWRDDADWRALTAVVAAWLVMHDNAWLEAAALVEAPLADANVGAERRLQLLLVVGRVSHAGDGSTTTTPPWPRSVCSRRNSMAVPMTRRSTPYALKWPGSARPATSAVSANGPRTASSRPGCAVSSSSTYGRSTALPTSTTSRAITVRPASASSRRSTTSPLSTRSTSGRSPM